MITRNPDPLLNPARLQGEIQAFRREIETREQWFIREKYVDRCQLDPYYIILFTHQVEDRGDDLMQEPLFNSRYSALTVKHITRQPAAGDRQYWKPINKTELTARLDRFMTMYLEDYLQPPGYRGDLHNPNQQHEKFREKRFVYRIGGGRKELIGIGSKMFAGSPMLGAVRGKVMDESGAPLVGVTVELVAAAGNITRQSREGGIVWFSRVQPGTYHLRVRDRTCTVRIIEYEEFGNVKGWIADNEGRPVVGAEVKLYAPDNEIFSGRSNASGKFTTGPLPAFPYIMDIPGFLFTHHVTIVSDAIIGGILHDQQGNPLPGKTLVLKKDGSEVAQTVTDAKGNFIFIELLGGKYQIELPGSRLYAKEIVGGAVKGKISDATVPMKIELIAKEKAILEERTTAQYNFLFDNVVPGTYRVKTGQITGRDV
jgi:hypothetical protein